VGDSNEKAKLNQMVVEHDLSNNVTLFGGKFGAEKDQLLQQMDVFVHPSRNEGLPTSVIEAASFGKPCIVTDATNIADLIAAYQCGETISHQDSHALSTAMSIVAAKWYTQTEFVAMRLQAVAMVKENFNWKKVIQAFNAQLYKA
jgi:glycosyltransferase involved in cell wall biosynthesis